MEQYQNLGKGTNWRIEDVGGYLRLLNSSPPFVAFLHRLALSPFHCWFKEITEQYNLDINHARPGSRTRTLFEETARIFKRISLEGDPSFGNNVYSKDTLEHINEQLSKILSNSQNSFLVKIVSGENQRDTNPEKLLAQLIPCGHDAEKNPARLPTLEIGEQILNPSLSSAQKKFILTLLIAKAQAAAFIDLTPPNDPKIKFLWKIARLSGVGRDKENKLEAQKEVVANLLIAREMWRLSKHFSIKLLGYLNYPVGKRNKIPNFFQDAAKIVNQLDLLPVFCADKIIAIRGNITDSSSSFSKDEKTLIKKIWNKVSEASTTSIDRNRHIFDHPVSFREATSQAHWLAKKGYSVAAVLAALMSALDDTAKEKIIHNIFKGNLPKEMKFTVLEAYNLTLSKKRLVADAKNPLLVPGKLETNTPLLQNEIDRMIQLYCYEGQRVLEGLSSSRLNLLHKKAKFSQKSLDDTWAGYASDLEGLVTSHFLESLRPEYDGTSYQKVSKISQYIRLTYAHFLERIGKGDSSNKLRHEVQRHYPEDYDIVNNFMREERDLSIQQTRNIFLNLKNKIIKIAEEHGVSVEVFYREKEYGSVADKVMRSIISFLHESERFRDYIHAEFPNLACYFLNKQLDLLGIRVIFKDSADLHKVIPSLLAFFDSNNWSEKVGISVVRDPSTGDIQLVRDNFLLPEELLPDNRKSRIHITGEIRFETEQFANEEKVGRAQVKYCYAHWQMKMKELYMLDFLRKIMTQLNSPLTLATIDAVAPKALKIIEINRAEFLGFSPIFSFRDPNKFNNPKEFFLKHAELGKIVCRPTHATLNGQPSLTPGTPEEVLVSIIDTRGKRTVVRMPQDAYASEVPLQINSSIIYEIATYPNGKVDGNSKIRVGAAYAIGEKVSDANFLPRDARTLQGVLYNQGSTEAKDLPSNKLFSAVLGVEFDHELLKKHPEIINEWNNKVFSVFASWYNSQLEELIRYTEIAREHTPLYHKILSELGEFKSKRFVTINTNVTKTADGVYDLQISFDEKQSGFASKVLSVIEEESRRLNIDYSILDFTTPINASEGELLRISLDSNNEEFIKSIEFRLKLMLLSRNKDVPNTNPQIRNISIQLDDCSGEALLRVTSALYSNGQYIRNIQLPTREDPSIKIEIWGEDIGIEYHAYSPNDLKKEKLGMMLSNGLQLKEEIIRALEDGSLPGRKLTINEVLSFQLTELRADRELAIS